MSIQNTSSDPYFLFHQSFVTKIEEASCALLHDEEDVEKCAYVLNTDACKNVAYFINYLEYFYCFIDRNNPIVTSVYFFGMVLMLLYLILFVKAAAGKFFCPALNYLADLLQLSPYVAGATLVAFGNNAPYVISAINDTGDETESVYITMVGGPLFVIGCIGGLTLIVCPCSLSPSGTMRDISILIITCIWLLFAFDDETIDYVDLFGAIIIYLVYFIALAMKQIRYKSLNVEDVKPAEDETKHDTLPVENDGILKLLLTDIFMDIKPWAKDSNPFKNLFHFVTNVPDIILRLIIPVVSSDMKYNGWNRLLNATQIVTLPFVFLLLRSWHFNQQFFELYEHHLEFIIGVHFVTTMLAGIVFCKTRTNRAPRYHWAIAMMGSVIGSSLIISIICAEIGAIIVAIGTIIKISTKFLSITLLHWGSRLTMFISTFTLTRRGQSQMAFASCLANPLIGTLMFFVLLMGLRLYRSDNAFVHARIGALGPTITIFLVMLLVFTVIGLYTTRFQGRRSIGALMLTIYTIYLLFCTLTEFEIIHNYGTDHQIEEDA